MLAEVAEHHRLDVDRRTEVMGNAGGVAIVDRALAVPRGEHRLDGHPQLLGGIGRELRRDVAEAGDDRAEVVDGEVGIAGDAPRDASAREHVFEQLVAESQDDGAEHLDKPAV